MEVGDVKSAVSTDPIWSNRSLNARNGIHSAASNKTRNHKELEFNHHSMTDCKPDGKHIITTYLPASGWCRELVLPCMCVIVCMCLSLSFTNSCDREWCSKARHWANKELNFTLF